MKLKEMSLARGRYRIVMMSCGYVESNKTAWLIFTTFSESERFDTAAQAVMELALDLYAKYEDEVLSTRHTYQTECCKKSKQDAENQYCPKCGARLKDSDFQSFMEYVTALHNTDCDSYGESETTTTRDFAFWPWRADEIIGAGMDEVVCIGGNAERVILDALYETRDDLRKIEYQEELEDWRCSDWLEVRKRGKNH